MRRDEGTVGGEWSVFVWYLKFKSGMNMLQKILLFIKLVLCVESESGGLCIQNNKKYA